MLYITIPEQEIFDDATQTFISVKDIKLQLEHSLVSLKKWESKWKKPFLETKMTPEEFLSYVECMTITQNVDPAVYLLLTPENIEEINNYINDPMTATTFTNRDPNQGRGKKEIVTAEIIYYWMVAQQIPMECQKWHLNQLMTLIRVCSIKNAPPKKMSKAETMARHRAANAKARARSRGGL
jgi:hypothetical protein